MSRSYSRSWRKTKFGVATTKISDNQPEIVRLELNVSVICREGDSHERFPRKEKKQLKCAYCKGPYVANCKGCPAYKKQVFLQYVMVNQKSYTSNLKQNSAHLHNPRLTLHFLSRPANKICSHCGHLNR